MAKTRLNPVDKFNLLMERLLKEHEIRVFPNALGSFTATAKKHGKGRQIDTDDFTPLKAIRRLHDKVFKEGQYATGGESL